MRRHWGIGLLVILTLWTVDVGAAVRLTAETSQPDLSTVALGEALALNFESTGLTPGQALSLELTFVNEQGATLATRALDVVANAQGRWQSTVQAPADHLGFYRVEARLSNGVQLEASGSRPVGALTYAVVPDPAQRVDYGEQSYFGMQGGFGRNWRESAMRYLGARWELDAGFEWRRNEPSYAGQWDGHAGSTPHDAWSTYRLPTLFIAPDWAVIPSTHVYNTGALTPQGEAAWADYVGKAVTAFQAKYPDRETNIYQVTWEPIRSWGFRGTPEQLMRIYEIAYDAIHAADPDAIVAGPTMGIHDEGAWPGHYDREEQSVKLFDMGLAQYIDAFTVHPYYANDFSAGGPEAEGMIDRVRYLKAIVEQAGAAAGKSLPMYGTEQGMADDGTPEGELRVARSLIRQNLIMMGEGFDLNFGFFAVDYSSNGGASVDRYGYFYNLDDGVPWGPSQGSPKPIVPAYAAQSLLLDGHEAAGAIEDMGGTRWGYRFQQVAASRTVQALWDYGNAPSTYSLYTGLDRVLAYDWMGNPRWLTGDDGYLTLNLGQEPVYLVTPPAWDVDQDGDWSAAENWTTLVPDAVGAEAHFTGKIRADRSISVSAPVTVGALYFHNANRYLLTGPGGLTLDTTGDNALIHVAGGRHVLATPLGLARDLDVVVTDADAAITLAGALQGGAGRALTKQGAGELAMSQATIAFRSLDLQQGRLRLGSQELMDLHGSITARTGSELAVDGGPVIFRDAVDIEDGAELRITDGSTALFLDDVRFHEGARTAGGGAAAFHGEVRVGDSPARQLYDFDVTLGPTGTLVVEIDLTNPSDPQVDQHIFQRNLTLDRATLQVRWVGAAGADPIQDLELGDSFHVVDVLGTLEGEFRTFDLPALPGDLRWDTSRLYGEGTLAVVPEPGVLGLMVIAGGALLRGRSSRR